ncbi:PSP1 domain-containing protein [Geobacter argillaceus]|uniref:Cell fate regulator YaaT (PSP1 superfamily) n=1 Tax=Geobacter argillaceus TaxID=345631 RepID=A0A562W9L0_9BACT|nr:stage 0 sporulation family protein [Geobacter argillaceus]TWJ26374.1 cell fate regulator YaaT (PSP1 superfamily) [Geobacter argillaceus]
MSRIVKVQFHTADKLYDFDAGSLELAPGDRVIVETERGKSIAAVVSPPREYPPEVVPEGLKQILRLVTPDDLAAAARNATREKEAADFCIAKIQDRAMDMKLVKVEYLYDGSKAIFYFTAEGRVDFRELVKDLAHQFHTRIEMRQIGVRDEAKLVGGIGICGRELCCCSFLREFAPVSVKMAKEQNLALNPTKISGQCGRLLCCLGYEFDTYCNLRKGMPKCGKHFQCGNVSGEVTKLDILNRSFTLRTVDNREVHCRLDDMSGEQITETAAPQPPPRTQPAEQGGQNRGQREERGKGEKQGSGRPQNRGRRNRDQREKKEKP